MTESAELRKLYAELEAINVGASALGPNESPSINTIHRFNAILVEFAQKTSDQNITSYMVNIYSRPNSRIESVRPGDLRQNAYTVTRLIHENYLSDSTLPPKVPISPAVGVPPVSQTFQQSQDNTQVTEVSVEFNQTIITLTEILTKKEAELEEGTPEKSFIKKLKSTLSSAKNGLDVLRLVLALAAEFGLTIQQIKHLLN